MFGARKRPLRATCVSFFKSAIAPCICPAASVKSFRTDFPDFCQMEFSIKSRFRCRANAEITILSSLFSDSTRRFAPPWPIHGKSFTTCFNLRFERMLNNVISYSLPNRSQGHPDKVCDQISDAVLDAYLALDNTTRVACESLTTTDHVTVAGEISTSRKVTSPKIRSSRSRAMSIERYRVRSRRYRF